MPAHWGIPKLKHLARIRNGRDYKIVEVESGGYPVIGSGGEFARANDFLYDGESVLLGRKGTIDKPLYINGPFWTVDTMFYTELSHRVVGRFLYYYATCFQFDQYSTNTALPSMAQEDLANIYMAAPGPSEQAHIAAFLDHETARIDALVAEQHRLIELLKEKRQAVISHAVTKGLDPDVPMKDSGVEWLGEVPAHWDVVRIKNVSSFLTSGPRGWSDFINDEGEDIFLQSGDLGNHLNILFDKAKRITTPQGAEGVRTRLQNNDVVVCITGANTGRVAVINEVKERAYVNQHLGLIRPHASLCCSRFLGYSLASIGGQTYFNVEQYGLKEGLSLTNLAEAPTTLPSLTEQSEIAQQIDTQLNHLDGLSTDAEVAIKLLQERRSALISAAVTGKIDVRGWQPPADSALATGEATQMEAV
ncbi:restriction endonuclease subunit S [Halomonas sp. CUBES01]|uniref:restriction endonuclease subunit S n=1 Tax=Halomonas sp. CUBES01 TaxID=2897340 RepID=UPI001E3991E3|nr:restriction endonuclease subunit S [Halomonas sp. CUBES01]MEC4768201.1 restriction endonuclease subunit S [Halomonas sp. CUBES01]